MSFQATGNVALAGDGTVVSIDFEGPAVTLKNLDGRRCIYFSDSSTPAPENACILGPGESITIHLDGSAVVLYFRITAGGQTWDSCRMQYVGYRP